MTLNTINTQEIAFVNWNRIQAPLLVPHKMAEEWTKYKKMGFGKSIGSGSNIQKTERLRKWGVPILYLNFDPPQKRWRVHLVVITCCVSEKVLFFWFLSLLWSSFGNAKIISRGWKGPILITCDIIIWKGGSEAEICHGKHIKSGY